MARYRNVSPRRASETTPTNREMERQNGDQAGQTGGENSSLFVPRRVTIRKTELSSEEGVQMKKPSKLKCIRDYCLDCAGGSAKEVTLCHVFDCPLWEYRTGTHISSQAYKRRMERAFSRYPEEFAEIEALMGQKKAVFLSSQSIKSAMNPENPGGEG